MDQNYGLSRCVWYAQNLAPVSRGVTESTLWRCIDYRLSEHINIEIDDTLWCSTRPNVISI